MKYFNQAWNLIKQEKLFSSIYIIGTGLSVTIVMVLSIVYYVSIVNVYPETNRDRMLIVKYGVEKSGDGMSSGDVSYNFIETCLMPVETIEAVTAVREGHDNNIQLLESKQRIPITLKQTDTSFWKVFRFKFVDGAPFSEADMQSGIRSAVISESLAKKLFGTSAVVGKHVNMDFDDYRVCGVVKDVSFVTERTFADMWIPFTVSTNYKGGWSSMKMLGNFKAYILSPSVKDMDKIKEEVLENVRKLNSAQDDNWELTINGQPDRQWQSIFRIYSNQEIDFGKVLWQYGLVFFILLFVPAVSLSGMTDSRMERRLSEMGIRRTFGAPVGTLMNQIVSENLLFTLLGGAFGLLFSYALILLSRNWIMQIAAVGGFAALPPAGTDVIFSPGMLLNIPVFLIALLVCFILNLLSALIPAWRASHRQIIYSLNAK